MWVKGMQNLAGKGDPIKNASVTQQRRVCGFVFRTREPGQVKDQIV
jgi:hypothetical protein